MDKMKMHTPNKADENFEKLAAMFPNAITETIDENGVVVRAIDKDVLMQEISCTVVEGREERYQFTWPDKKKSVLTANAPINKTLRPVREDETVPTGSDSEGNPYCSTGSVNFDNTENLYIEGDNLEVLKLLQETYLGKIKMIYIDPPYNTGNDFVYEDDFAQSTDEYITNSGQLDEEGNRLVANTESNGRFHTDWLNMIYPRLKIAKNLLEDNGAIFISIDDNELNNLLKVCDEVFGESNYCCTIPYRKRTMKTDVPFGISQDYEWVVVYAKSDAFFAGVPVDRKYYSSPDYPDDRWRLSDLTTQKIESQRPNSAFDLVNPRNGEVFKYNPKRLWAITKDTFSDYYNRGKIVFPGDYDFLNISIPAYRVFESEDRAKSLKMYGSEKPLKSFSTVLASDVGMNEQGSKEIDNLVGNKVFTFPKPSSLVYQFLLSIHDKNAIILDFFSGSATTAHAVMQLNAEDNGNRKFIMVQLPEVTDEKSEACKAGYKNICEIGKERIRRAAKKIAEENTNSKFDAGFRVLKCDSSNMKDVYYNPEQYEANLFISLTDNIKEDRIPEDLLFQVMLDLGVELSSKIAEYDVAGKKVFNVADGFLIACFDDDVTEETIKAVAKLKPYYFVMRDSSMADDSVATNFEQLFVTYSPETVRKVL
jgi:site-specific DNA-methyltransferase (type III DNA modification enzyme)